MHRYKSVLTLIPCILFLTCFGQLSIEQTDKFVNGFVEYLNNLPNRVFTYDDGILLNAQKKDDSNDCYNIEVRVRAVDPHNLDVSRYLRCSAIVQDLEENGIDILDNQHPCEDIAQVTEPSDNGNNLEEVIIDEQTTSTAVHQPVNLDNEVQPNTGLTSGEEFIAVPRRKYGGTCVGCSTHVNPQAPGVNDLALLAIKHLARHEPNTKHMLESVLDVERTVQVVNGVRYTLTLKVSFDNCTLTKNEPCIDSRVCKIAILEKSWIKLADGSKYRAILSNNCTQDWIFGDEGEHIPNNDSNDIHLQPQTQDNLDEISKPILDYDKIANTGSVDEILKEVHNTDVQAQISAQKHLTETQLKDLEEQIIPHDKIYTNPSINFESSKNVESENVDLHHVPDFESAKHFSPDSSIQYKESADEKKPSLVNDDKKKAIDDLLNFFNSAGFHNVHDDFPRVKRSYENELKAMSVAEKIYKIKKNVKKAKYLYILAQQMVNYLNEMDLEVKNRVLQDVLAAEEEFENYQDFFYIQARVVIPCEKVYCNSKDLIKICNGVIEITDREMPQILSAFCYDDNKKNSQFRKTEAIPLNDPVLLKLAKEGLKKIELESKYPNAMQIVNILQADTIRASDSITKIIVSLGFIDCNKTVPLKKRTNCTMLYSMDSNVCEIYIHKRHSLKEKKITYKCIERPIDETLSDEKQIYNEEGTITDTKILDMVHEALQRLEMESNKKNKQKVVKINSVSSHLIGGLITEIEFVVGYTKCSSEFEVDLSLCELLDNSMWRNCKAQIWERPWIENGRQINVSCIDSKPKEELISRKKRSNDLFFVGGQVNKDPNDLKYKLLATESLQNYLTSNRIEKNYEVVQVINATVQVVSGKLTKIYFTIASKGSDDREVLCNASIWERPWLKSKIITTKCDNSNVKSIQKRQVLGQPSEQNPNNSHYINLAEKSMETFLEGSENKKCHKILKIEKVSKTVVAGILITLDFLTIPVSCSFNETNTPASSSSESDYPHFISCHSEIWQQLWKHKEQINVTCHEIDKNMSMPQIIQGQPEKDLNGDDISPERVSANFKSSKRSKRALKGKKVKQDPNKEEYKLLAEKSLQKYRKSKMDKSLNLEVTEVLNVVKQVVSGIKYNIEFLAKSAPCLKNEECKNYNMDTLYCHSNIWRRPWMGRDKIDVNCVTNIENEGNESNRTKRQARFGTPLEKDVFSENYILLAKQALVKYQQLLKTKYVHKIIKIHNISEQVSSGIVTKFDFSISPTNCLIDDSPITDDICNIISPKNVLRCYAEVWDRPWIKSDKDIAIDCKKEYSKISVSNTIKETNKGRYKRQLSPPEDYIDEDTKYYYADRAVHYINDKSNTNNLQKLVTIHAFQNSMNMGVNTVRMYIETAYTFCLRHQDEAVLSNCEELSGMYHRLCYVRLWPTPDDELVVKSMAVVCDDEEQFKSVTGISITDLVKASIKELEASPKTKYKLVHQGEPNVIPSLDSNTPILVSFIAVPTNCSKYIDVDKYPSSCFIDISRLPKTCTSFIWLVPNSRKIKKITSSCAKPNPYRSKRSITLDSTNVTSDEKAIQNFVKESLEKLEMSSLHKYKQRVLQINSFKTKIAKGRLTTIDFDVGYTTCLKYEWVDNITECEFIEHLPRRHCISKIRERLWLDNGRQIDVNCEDDETPLEATIEFESTENAMELAREALKHIEAKYPHPRKQKVVRIFSLEKQEVAGVHYRMKMEVGFTDCLALSIKYDCKLVNDIGLNKFCRVNIWLRPWTEHPPAYRVSCDYQDGTTNEIYHHVQTEHLFSDFVTTYRPDYINDRSEMQKRYEIFKDNVRKIHDFNIHERGTAIYAVTRFSDLTYEEFGQKYLGLKPSLRDTNQIPMRKADIPNVHVPDEFDWRHHDAVTEVKDQGSCGSCWAFSVTGNIEGQWKMHSGELMSLSEQELVDCDKLDQGCNGGLPDNAYRAIEELGGLETENDYPYEAENDKCAFNKTLSRVQISGAVNISSNETDMAKWLVQNGPISVGINANAMQFYVGGVSHPWRMLCSPKNLDHGVLIVGYGVKDYPLFKKRLPYWIVKNSWGKGWGEQGYYRVYRGDGTCGVNQMASSAVI